MVADPEFQNEVKLVAVDHNLFAWVTKTVNYIAFCIYTCNYYRLKGLQSD